MIDELRIKVTASDGGDGRVAFEKKRGMRGVTGGDGGNGGSVYMEAVSDLSALRNYRFKKSFSSKKGQDGGVSKLKGKNGEDLIIKVPIGTIAHNLDTGEDFEILDIGQRLMIAKGGKGGRGNWQFRSSTNRAPQYAEEGRSGQTFDYYLELKLIADIGFIGLPSAGKSSLLNALTNASVKTAEYHFTTLEANLGVYYPSKKAPPIILADIPGLIEGASQGKGLGDKFLRHIQRTQQLIHCISAESENLAKDYKTIRSELKLFDKHLTPKPEHLLLTKTDILSREELKQKMKELAKLNPSVYNSSIKSENGLKALKKLIEKNE